MRHHLGLAARGPARYRVKVEGETREAAPPLTVRRTIGAVALTTGLSSAGADQPQSRREHSAAAGGWPSAGVRQPRGVQFPKTFRGSGPGAAT